MAGESPDRSKQRESSAEPTSGSAGAVPETGGGVSVPDPRLSVSRESVSLGGVDTATRVISVRGLPRDAENTPQKAPEKPSTPEEAPGGAQGASGGAGAGESAARASGDGESADVASPDGDDAAEGPLGADDATAEEASAVEGADREDSGAATEAVTEGASGNSVSDEADESGPGDSVAEESEGTRESVGSGAEESGALKGADAGAEERDGERDEPVEDSADDSESPAAASEDTAKTSDDSDDSDHSDAADNSAERDKPAPAGDARLRNAVAAWVASADEKPTEPKTESEPKPESESESKPEAGDAPQADSAAKAEPDEDTDDAPNPAGARGTARPAPTDPRSTDKPANAPANTPVDQPTAVFKAVRPPVDQPTTMLKLGKTAEPDSEPDPKPEAPAERTSKFVALKPLDEPREPRAPKPPEATAVIPQVGPERTTQQPLPPKPPLDLLAELTNTPPPPPSPFRTLARRIKIWTPLVVLLVIVFAVVQALRPLPIPKLTLTGEDTYTFDGSSTTLPWPSRGQGWMDVNGIGTMGNFGKQTPVGIGSVAKAMTAYIVLKDHPMKSGEDGAKITVDALAEKEGGYDQEGESTLSTVKAGDVLTEREAITAIMIPSANNIARLLARWDAGSEAAFIKKMNATAKELGMTNTTYTDASGLKETTVSTAEDQVKLGNELVRMPALMEITSMGQWTDPSGKKWYNYNYLVPYNGAIGIKTGTTTAAGGNLLFAARKEVGGETVTIVGAILGQHKTPIIQTVNDVSKTAMLAAQDALTSAKILKKGDVVGYVDDGLGGRTAVVLTKDVTAVGWAGMKVKLSLTGDDVPHAAKAGAEVGTLTVGDEENGAIKVPVTLQKDLVEPGLTDKLKRLG